MKLYDYFRSSASYRVRITLQLKQLEHELIEVHLVQDGGQQHHPDYVSQNPQGLVPLLVDDQIQLTQSMAILEYLEEKHPSPSILPSQPLAKAQARQLAMIIACDIHPLNNLRVLKYLTGELQHNDNEKIAWYRHWVIQGFAAMEKWLERYQSNGQFCIGDKPSIADICLIPQVYNALRFECDLAEYPLILSINEHCLSLPAFANAAP